LRKSGFTIVEFIISISAMVIIMAAVFPITFDKVKNPTPVRNDVTLVCGCGGCLKKLKRGDDQDIYELVASDKYDFKNVGTNTFEFKIKEMREFATIQLVGGGAGGSSVGGVAGESKTVHLPMIKGEYKAEYGRGGGGGQNGQPSAFYQKIDNQWVLIASARGGIASPSENATDAGLSNEGQNPAIVVEDGTICGKGGTNGAGTAGAVIITW